MLYCNTPMYSQKADYTVQSLQYTVIKLFPLYTALYFVACI